MSTPVTMTRSLACPPTPRKRLHERNGVEAASPTRQPRLIAAMRRLKFSRDREDVSPCTTHWAPDTPPFDLEWPEYMLPRSHSPPLQVFS